MTFKYPAEELGQAGAPPLPEGYFYTFEVLKSGNLNGYLWNPTGKQIGQQHIWVANLFSNDQQIRTWEIQDLVHLAKALYEEAFPGETPKERFAPDISRFLSVKFHV